MAKKQKRRVAKHFLEGNTKLRRFFFLNKLGEFFPSADDPRFTSTLKEMNTSPNKSPKLQPTYLVSSNPNKKMHAIYLGIIGVLLLAILFLGSNGSFAGKAIESFDTQTGAYCQDLDKENFEVSGITTIYDKSGKVVEKKNDYCSAEDPSSHLLVEVSCDGKRAAFLEEKTFCHDGCKNGACIPHPKD